MHVHRSSAFVVPAVLVVALSACGSSDVNQPTPPPVDPRVYQQTALRAAVPQKTPFEAERDSIEAFRGALAQWDTKTLASLTDPDADFSFPGMSDASDRDGMLQDLNELFGAFSTRKCTTGRTWQVGEVAIVEWSFSGVQSGDWMGVRATQKAVAFPGLSLFTFNLNGLVNDLHVYFDVGGIMAQLGVPQKGTESGPAPTPSAPATAIALGNEDEKKNVLLVNASWDALEAKNEAGYVAPMADDIDVARFDRGVVERGKDYRRKYYKWVTHGFSSLNQTPLNAWGVGPFVIEEYSISGVHSGKLTEGTPSGHAMRLHYVDIYELSGGKVVRMWTYGNSHELLAEISGLAPIPPTTAAPAPASPTPAKGTPAPGSGGARH